MAYIERAITPVLKRRAASSKCVLVTGARQVGKSTLIKHEFQNYHRANFDDRLTRLQAREEPKLYFLDTGLACYLTRWLTPDTLKCSAVAGNMFETFVVSEILKSYSNEGKDYRFHIFYYRGKDKKTAKKNEIDLVIEENEVQGSTGIK